MELLVILVAKQILKNALGGDNSFFLQKSQVPDRNGPFLICCAAMDKIVAPNRFSSASKEEQQNRVSPSLAAWIGLVRTALSAPILVEQVQAGLRVHRDGLSELTKGVKLVITRKLR